MTDKKYVVTTFRLPVEVHEGMKEYIEDFNYNVKWDEKKLNMTVLTGKALIEYMKRNPVKGNSKAV